MNPLSQALLFGMVLLLTLKEMTEACSCLPLHPQQQFCNAEIVIRAKVTRKEFIPPNNPDGHAKYTMKTIKMFKGFDKVNDIEHVFTPIESSLCGVELDADNKVEYLLIGNLRNGQFHINLCGWNKPWKHLTEFQIKSLSGTYQDGCLCKIINCSLKTCETPEKDQCLWRQWGQKRSLGESEALNNACIQGIDGSCNWYPGLPSKKPFFGSHP